MGQASAIHPGYQPGECQLSVKILLVCVRIQMVGIPCVVAFLDPCKRESLHERHFRGMNTLFKNVGL